MSKNIIVCIDPGHADKINPGIIEDFYEGTVMYELAEKIKEELEKYDGYKVVISKYSITSNPSQKERVNSALLSNAEYFISLHSLNNMHIIYDETIAVFGSKSSNETLREKLIDTITKNSNNRAYTVDFSRKINLNCLESDLDLFELMKELELSDIENGYIIILGHNFNKDFCMWIMDSNNQKQLAIDIANTIISYKK